MENYFSGLVNQSIERTKESTLGVLGINDAGLRAHIEEQMRCVPGRDESPLARPLFEHTFGWRTGDETLNELTGSLLHEDVFRILTEPTGTEYRFSKDLKPYRHQIESWRTLMAEEPRSLVVTTGTGSGKTECFMVPILDDLVRAQQLKGTPLVGVRALFLYPLNALINSQRERLDAWTSSFGERIRFCLYNGMTEESASTVRKDQSKKLNQVLSRELLRRSPPPILMTNATMLEYMLVRQRDEPIVASSREEHSLRWIVLDEAHTYIGSQAAELSLLLRRVIEAFGVRAEEIRFIATSATLSGPDAEKDLQLYLASLAGISADRVVVVSGAREVPEIVRATNPQDVSLETITKIERGSEESDARFNALCKSDVALALRDALTTSDAPPDLMDLVDTVRNLPSATKATLLETEVLSWLDTMTGTVSKENGQPFVKLRVHLFQRMLHGLWSCVDPKCANKPKQLDKWPFGRVFVVQRTHCTCKSPVLEIGFCNDCTAPHLIGEDVAGILCQPSQYVEDEFSLLSEQSGDDLDENDNESTFEGPNKPLLLGSRSDEENYESVTLDLDSAALCGCDSERSIRINITDKSNPTCNVCGTSANHGRNLLRMAYLGAPFYASNAVPTVLEYCPNAIKSETGGATAEELPAKGRRLITFSDSRQGTARLAVRMQQEAERSRLRGLVFRTLRNAKAAKASMEEGSSKSEAELLKDIGRLEAAGFDDLAAEKRKELTNRMLVSQAAFGSEMSWDDLVSDLATERDLQGSILEYNRYANPDMFGGKDVTAANIARLLLAREYSRRPKQQNSTETLGLVRIGYRALETVKRTPRLWEETKVSGQNGAYVNLTLQDWKDFLKVILDFYVRENTFVVLSPEEQRWLGSRFAPKRLVPYGSNVETNPRIRHWPLASTHPQSRPVRLLAVGAERNLEDPASRDRIDVWLRDAWNTLCQLSILSDRDGRMLEPRALTFSLPHSGWICPITHRVLDTTFRSLTPYLPGNVQGLNLKCRPVQLPDYRSLEPAPAAADPIRSIREQVGKDEHIQSLRAEGLWTDLSDRVVEGGFYYRTAEHSAQQSAKRLLDYERQFKQGRVNVLNCSTTMEMGVDIGGVTAIVMNNVPPHPANYLQRAGRAGRRSEPRAIAYTLCRNDPHDQRAFADPKWAFITPIRSPDITLDSVSLVRRHVHSFLLATFLRSEALVSQDNLKLTVQWFYGGEPSMASQFISWLKSVETELKEPLQRLTKGTALQNFTFAILIEPALNMFERFESRWSTERERLVALLEQNQNSPYGAALEKELNRHENEYLLRDLAVRGFLPSYGFPTDVVSLNTYNIEDYRNRPTKKGKVQGETGGGREDNIYRYKELPSRGMAVALREYAPGSQIVVDGRVHRSAGVSLHWQTPGAKVEDQKFDIHWRCLQCGTAGFRENAYVHSQLLCQECGRSIPKQEWKNVLQPSGFVTDFYEPTTNDVSSQTFVKMERPSISVDAPESPLPDAKCGFVRHGHEGHVFVHSAGKYSNGYAVCMRCGRSESMTASGGLPAELVADKMHRSVGGLRGSCNVAQCSGEGVKPNVYLGYRSRTDVLELALKNPISGQWLGAEPTATTIANTLALALRESIAGRLGIASVEIGYGCRVDKDRETGQKRAIVQIHDAAAGGAGFVLTGAEDIPGLLQDCLQRLDCPRDCTSVCPACLASGDGRVERDILDRIDARTWLLNSQILEHLLLPDPLQDIEGASAWQHSPRRFLKDALSLQAQSAYILIERDDLASWTFDTPEFRYLAALAKSGANSDFVLILPPEPDLTFEQLDQLRLLNRIGVELRTRDAGTEISNEVRIRLQVKKGDDRLRTLISTGGREVLEENAWLERSGNETLAVTDLLPGVPSALFDPGETVAPKNAEIIEFTEALNGPVRDLPQRFIQVLSQRASSFHEAITTDRVRVIEYSDRYLSSPWSMILLGSFLSALPKNDLESIRLVTGLRDNSTRRPSMLHHDWPSERSLRDATMTFFEELLGIEPVVDIKNQRNIAHRRFLRLQLVSGNTFTLSFDQGMGYWQSEGPKPDKQFDFGASPMQQAKAMQNACDRLKMINMGQAASDLSIQRS